MRVSILYDAPDWAFHNRARALQRWAAVDADVRIGQFNRHAPPGPRGHDHDFDQAVGHQPPDVLFVISSNEAVYAREALSRRGWERTRLVVGWNMGWTRHSAFQTTLEHADRVIFNNLDAWTRFGRLDRTHWISNGVDLEIFSPRVPLDQRPRRVLWCGSEYHRVVKGYDELILPLFARLEAMGVPTDALLVDSCGEGKRSPAEMARWYNQGAVYVCASEFEGTPNTALEAAACGCTIVSTPVGNMPELIRSGENGYLVPRTIADLERAVLDALERHRMLARNLGEHIRSWSWEHRARAYFDYFRTLLEAAA